jgi:hypothetical protein
MIAVAASGLLVAVRALAGGPVTVLVEITRPLNLESVAAVSLIVALLLRGRSPAGSPPSEQERIPHWAALGLVVALTVACYWRSLWFPLVSDDYVIVLRALRGELLPRTLTEGDAGVAFRPFTRFLFALQGVRGTADPAWWHAVGLVFHAANTVLVYRLARWLTAPAASLVAAAVFGLHAIHPEAVSWMNSRSDVMAAFFLMAALLWFLPNRARPRWQKTAAAMVSRALAIASKESAYAFLPLAGVLAGVRFGSLRRSLAALAPYAVVEAGMFGWRWHVLGGLVGYAAPGTGQSMFLSLNAWSTMKALCWRVWALLFFPVNWDWRAGPLLWLALAALAAALAVLSRAQAGRAALAACVAFVMLALLPVLPLALVGANLWGARVYYLASAGAALLVGVAWGGLGLRRLRWGAAAALLLFHYAALRHQLQAWESVARLTERTCAGAAPLVAAGGELPVVVVDMPQSVDGVPFLSNGFSECVQLAAGRGLPNALVNPSRAPAAAAVILRWDPQRRRAVTESRQ